MGPPHLNGGRPPGSGSDRGSRSIEPTRQDVRLANVTQKLQDLPRTVLHLLSKTHDDTSTVAPNLTALQCGAGARRGGRKVGCH